MSNKLAKLAGKPAHTGKKRRDGYRIVLVGAGSDVWTLRFAQSILREGLPSGELVLMDIDKERLSLLQKAVEKLFADRPSWRVESTSDLDEAVSGADYVVLTIAIGGLAAWKRDIETAAAYGALSAMGDTCGAAGISRCLRHVPFIVHLAKRMEKLCPDAWLFNYTNPLTALTQAVTRKTSIKAAGFCSGVPTAVNHLCLFLNVEPDKISYKTAGLDHCPWLVELRSGRRDLYPELRRLAKLSPAERMKRCRAPAARKHIRAYGPCLDVCRDTGYFPLILAVHVAEFYRPMISTAADLRAYGYRKGLTQPDIRSRRLKDARTVIEDILRGKAEYPGVGGGLLARPITAFEEGKAFTDSINYPNAGQMPDLEPGVVVETLARFDRTGIHPIPCGKLPATVKSLIAQPYYYQDLVIEAALESDPKKVVAALMTQPHSIPFDRLAPLAEELIRINAPYRPKA